MAAIKYLLMGRFETHFATYDNIWGHGKIPKPCDTSRVVPILKSGGPSTVIKNLRPTCLTLYPCKLFERRVLTRVT